MKPFVWFIIFDKTGERILLFTAVILFDASGEISIEHSDGIVHHLFVSCTVIIEFGLHYAPLYSVANWCVLTQESKIFILVDWER